MGPTVYIETTIPSYLTAWPSRDLIRAAHQQMTREWWDGRDAFQLRTSQLVIEECEAGDPQAAADRLVTLTDITLLGVTNEALALAEKLVREVPLPDRARADALHVATAAVHGVRYLLTWNCTHLANVVLRPRIESVCREADLIPPLICTPAELPTGRTTNVG